MDVNPGDRAATCGGRMQPVAVEKKKGGYRILHRCIICDHEGWNKAAPEDEFEVILQIAAENQFNNDA